MSENRSTKNVVKRALTERMIDRVASRTKSALSVGKEMESEKWRLHRYSDNVTLTSLENAGKRGKSCQIMVVSFDYIEGNALRDSIGMELVLLAKKNVSVDAMEKAIKDMAEEYEDVGKFGTGLTLSIRQVKGVHVTPAGFGPINIRTKNIEITVKMDDFHIRDLSEARRVKEKREDGITKIRMDYPNEPTCIPSVRGSKKGLPSFYRWVKDNESKLQSMTYSEVLSQLNSMGIDHHTYCAMD
jgi:hypothetical protein